MRGLVLAKFGSETTTSLIPGLIVAPLLKNLKSLSKGITSLPVVLAIVLTTIPYPQIEVALPSNPRPTRQIYYFSARS